MSKMNVLIVCHYAQEPPFNTMLRYHNWGKELVKNDYSVKIACASTVHNTNIDVIEKTRKDHSICDGVEYYYIKTNKYSGNGLSRIKNMLSFCLGLKGLKDQDPAVIICCEAYLFPFVRHFFKSTPIITDTVDLWPLSIIEYGNFSRLNPIIQILYWVERYSYIRSDALIFSMEGGKDYLMEQKYAKKIDFSKVFYINMGTDIDLYDKILGNCNEKLPWNSSCFNIVYCGSIRQANNVLDICKAALCLKEKGIDNVIIHIYGNGDKLEEIRSFVQTNRIDNVFIYGRIEKKRIPLILSQSDANILTYKQVGLMKYGGSQSKLFDYLTCGKPIICNARFGYNLIEKYKCGVVTKDQSAESIVDTIIYLLNCTPEDLESMGKRARQVSEMFSQPILVAKLRNAISYALKHG